MLPSLGRFREEAERAGLKFVDAFSFGKDYARTLREWSARMQARSGDIMALGYDQRFLRNWEFYLGICAASFNVARTDAAWRLQVGQLVNPRIRIKFRPASALGEARWTGRCP